MKWKKLPTEFLSEKTFLVIKDDLDILEKKGKQRGKTKTPDTGTWPPKVKRVTSLYGNAERPKTANLEKPSVLDPRLADKLDMSLLSKELLSDSMTRFRHTKAISGGVSSSCREDVTVGELQQQQHRPSSNGVATTWGNGLTNGSTRYKRRSFEQILDLRLGLSDVSAAESPRMQKQARITGQDVAVLKKCAENRKLDDNNNRNGSSGHKISSLSTLRRKGSRPTIQSDLEVFMSSSMKGAPEPCRSCGKPDQPERFHSHPKGTVQKPKDSPTNSKTKTSLPKTVHKPVALHFRSDKSKNKAEESAHEAKPKSGSPRGRSPDRPLSALTKKGPRTITCYICGREFGTASFPIHEPRCMQKWERENNSLPANQRRPTPKRPDVAIDHSEWNTAAWEKSQAQLLPCPKCARTFLPERLPVHQKSCKGSPKNLDAEKSDTSLPEKPVGTTRSGPPTVACQNCGRNFGTKSIKIHEPQCIKRSQVENSKQSAQSSRKQSQGQRKLETASMREISTSPVVDQQQKRSVTCYICGRDFGSSSLAIHEPQCLKKWHAENEKLPPDQRRKEPQRPEVIYARDPETGNVMVDVAAMAEASWKSHLNQLVPCKNCGRTFNPDRVSVHERSCRGNR